MRSCDNEGPMLEHSTKSARLRERRAVKGIVDHLHKERDERIEKQAGASSKQRKTYGKRNRKISISVNFRNHKATSDAQNEPTILNEPH